MATGYNIVPNDDVTTGLRMRKPIVCIKLKIRKMVEVYKVDTHKTKILGIGRQVGPLDLSIFFYVSWKYKHFEAYLLC